MMDKLPTLPQNTSLQQQDPEIFGLIQEERNRQICGLELVASENFTSTAVLQALGSCLTNKYSEGLPDKRYYGGNEVIDKIENLAISRALTTFHLNSDSWGANVQPYSGSVANLAVYLAVLKPGDTFLGLSLNSGGHLTHGHQTPQKKISASAIIYNAVAYGVDQNGIIDYKQLEELTLKEKPKLIVCGASAYPRDWDYRQFRVIADKVGALLMCDMAHIAGLVAAQECNDPFQYCDIVTTTTHKSLRGPRAGIIFFRKGKKLDIEGNSIGTEVYNFEQLINFAVFPSLQGGPHENQIAAIAVAMLEAQQVEFKHYVIQLKLNAKTLAAALIKLGHTIVTGGTDNHLFLWDLRPFNLTGSKVEKACDLIHITVNKNMIVGDTSALTPGGIRLGTSALTSRGLKEAQFELIAIILDKLVKVCIEVQKTSGKLLKDFVIALEKSPHLEEIQQDVLQFSQQFGIPGF